MTAHASDSTYRSTTVHNTTIFISFYCIVLLYGQVLQEQPLVVAVSRTAHSGAAMPSTMAPLDAATGQLLLRPGIISATCHGTAAPAAGVVPQPSLVSARAPLTVDTAVPTTMLPLGVVVTTDVPSTAALNKVRHMSPEVAKNLLQQSGL